MVEGRRKDGRNFGRRCSDFRRIVRFTVLGGLEDCRSNVSSYRHSGMRERVVGQADCQIRLAAGDATLGGWRQSHRE